MYTLVYALCCILFYYYYKLVNYVCVRVDEL